MHNRQQALLPVAANLLEQNFVAHRPDQVWLADITYIPTSEGWLYLAVILELFTRQLVGWAMREPSVPNSPSPRSSWRNNGGARERASSIIPIAAAKADSTDRRNTIFVGLSGDTGDRVAVFDDTGGPTSR